MSAPDPCQIELDLHSEAEQEALGAALARGCRAPALVYLDGDLGAGKTTLVRGWLRGLGHAGAVKSPTYTLIEPYDHIGQPIYHLDLYRLGDPGELEYLGLREMLAEDAILLIEWPERGAGWLPTADLEILIRHTAEGRHLTLKANSDKGKKMLDDLDPGFK